MKVWIIGGLTLAVGIAACSNQVKITAENAGSTQGAGGAGPSGTTSAGGPSSSTGAGASGPGLGKMVTADTDIGQSVAISIPNKDPASNAKVLEGPFFVTDVIGLWRLTTVQGGDCGVPEELHTLVVRTDGQPFQLHGMRLPVLSGQSLCASSQLSIIPVTTVLGFKPY